MSQSLLHPLLSRYQECRALLFTPTSAPLRGALTRVFAPLRGRQAKIPRFNPHFPFLHFEPPSPCSGEGPCPRGDIPFRELPRFGPLECPRLRPPRPPRGTPG